MQTKDSLGDRMKEYEDITRYKLPKKSYVLARIDGKAFHTYCKKLEKPFDTGFIDDMDSTAIRLCENIQNVEFAYVQSDEISLFLHEKDYKSEAWYGNNIQKMTSVSASIATAEFNKKRLIRSMEIQTRFQDGIDRNLIMNNELENFKMAEFDSRFWTVPSAIEVHNYFLWRQKDATRNSISSVAQSLYPHKELEGVKSDGLQEMIFQKGINWNDLPAGQKRGRFIEKVTYINDRKGSLYTAALSNITNYIYTDLPGLSFSKLTKDDVVRNKWEVVESPIFSSDQNFLMDKIKN